MASVRAEHAAQAKLGQSQSENSVAWKVAIEAPEKF